MIDNEFYTKHLVLQEQFTKGEITFDKYSTEIIKWNKDFGEILKAQPQNAIDQSKGGKLIKKEIIDKNGKKVTKWVSRNEDEKERGGKRKKEPVSDNKNAPTEASFTKEEWAAGLKVASDKALDNASKYAKQADIRAMARNEIFRRSINPKQFIDLSLMPDFLLDDYVGRYNKDKVLTDQQEQAINSYRDTGYVRVNKALRSDPLSLDREDKATVREIDKMIDESEFLNDVTLHRGLSGKDSLLFINYLKSLEVGEVFEEAAFSSTSLVQTSADKFKNLYSSTQNVSLKLYAKKGQKGLCMQNLGDATNQDMYKDEYEFLLPRNQKFQIVESNGNEITVILL